MNLDRTVLINDCLFIYVLDERISRECSLTELENAEVSLNFMALEAFSLVSLIN